MIRDLLKGIVGWAVRDSYDISPDNLTILIDKTSHEQFGDYTTNVAFNLAKILKTSPQEIATKLSQEINNSEHKEIAKVEAVGGYVNFFLGKDFLRDELREINKSIKSFGHSQAGVGKKIIVEYSQPNIAKKMHIGHLRTTVMGDALANLYDRAGYQTIRWNYIGDWGTQFGKLIAAYKLWGNKKEVKANPIQTLLNLYVRFHVELKTNPGLEKLGQEEFKKLEDGDKENRRLWQWFKKESLIEFNRLYKILDVKFDVWIGESFYENQMEPLVQELIQQKVAQTGEGGAIIINLDKYHLPPALIRKSDGASLYLTRDIANLKYRIAKYNPSKIFYVVANEQALHFEQLFAVAKVLGLDQVELQHLKYGLVLGENKKKMATREGESIPLEDVIEEAMNLARDIVEKKNPTLKKKEKELVARTVALGALKYEMLKDNRNSDIVFDWNQVLDFTGNSGPYLQYTYARLVSIKRKAGRIGKYDGAKLESDQEFSLIKKLLDFPDIIDSAIENYGINAVALYLYELANLANTYYESTPILKDEDSERRTNRVILISTVAEALKKGLGILGIQTLERI